VEGRAGDGGVDIRGSWGLWPLLKGEEAEEAVAERSGRPPSRSLVIVQSKASGKPVAAAIVRELIGAYVNEPAKAMQQPRAEGANQPVAFLVALSGFTVDAIETASSASMPLVLLHLEPTISGALATSASSGRWLKQDEMCVRGYTCSRGLLEMVAAVRACRKRQEAA
jgi:hypothetical protein